MKDNEGALVTFINKERDMVQQQLTTLDVKGAQVLRLLIDLEATYRACDDDHAAAERSILLKQCSKDLVKVVKQVCGRVEELVTHLTQGDCFVYNVEMRSIDYANEAFKSDKQLHIAAQHMDAFVRFTDSEAVKQFYGGRPDAFKRDDKHVQQVLQHLEGPLVTTLSTASTELDQIAAVEAAAAAASRK